MEEESIFTFPLLSSAFIARFLTAYSHIHDRVFFWLSTMGTICHPSSWHVFSLLSGLLLPVRGINKAQDNDPKPSVLSNFLFSLGDSPTFTAREGSATQKHFVFNRCYRDNRKGSLADESAATFTSGLSPT